jgi:hypothetical protein
MTKKSDGSLMEVSSLTWAPQMVMVMPWVLFVKNILEGLENRGAGPD